MARELKIWNGNLQSLVPHGFAAEHKLRHNSYVHGYGCARSRADLCRMICAWAGRSRGLDAYIRDYWSEGAWGNSMNGTKAEPGLWVAVEHGKPMRVWPPDSKDSQSDSKVSEHYSGIH